MSEDNQTTQPNQVKIFSEQKPIENQKVNAIVNSFYNLDILKQVKTWAVTCFNSGVYGNKFQNPDQMIVVMMCGLEMGKSGNWALQNLYIVNGTVKHYAAAGTQTIREAGYQVEYIDEEPGVKVTAVVTRKNEKFFFQF